MATGTVVDLVTEEVATNLEEVAEATRRLNPSNVGYFSGGLGVGVAIGFFFGYRFNKEKLRAEAFKKSEEEVAQIREEYQRRTAAVEKAPLEEIIEERGYAVVREDPRPLPTPVPLISGMRSVTREDLDAANAFGAHPALVSPTVNTSATEVDIWDYQAELQKRTQEEPYIIHRDEKVEMQNKDDGYDSVTYTYYAEDDVLTDSDDDPLPNADQIVGQDNLKFGHGSDDPNVVFVRNDRLQLDMEIVRSPGSYEREVMGLETETELEHSDRRTERRRTSRRYRSEDESS